MTQPAETLPAPPAPSHAEPDWETLTEEVRCPLCDYNLFSLREPRCPECGYRFEWPDLLDPARRLHPWLFEHHPRRNFWSFWRTLAGGLRPARFWRSLKPSQPSRPRRLLAYWSASLLMFVVWAVAGHAASSDAPVFWNVYHDPVSGWTGPWNPTFSPAAYWTGITITPPAKAILWLGVAWAAWCATTLLSLMIFRASMRKAKVKTVHVLRCVLYSFDAGAWAGLLLLAAGLAGLALRLLDANSSFDAYEAALPLLWALPPLAVYRLYRAYRDYLHFHLPLATVLASQVIACLALFIAFLYVAIDL